MRKNNMKVKIILVSLLTSLSMPIFANNTGVDIYGRLREVIQTQNVGGVSTSSIISDSSYLGFKVGENLGNGLRVNGVVETFIFMDGPPPGTPNPNLVPNNPPINTTNTLGDKKATLGMSYKKYGHINMGRDDNALFNITKRFDFNRSRYGTLYRNIYNSRSVRLNNAVFLLANPVDWATLEYQVGLSETPDQSNIQAWNATIRLPVYNGRLVYAQYIDDSRKATTNFYGFRFEPIKNTKLAYSQGTSDNGSLIINNKPTPSSINMGRVYAIEQNVGRFDLLASYGNNNLITSAVSIGARYNFSKRTKVELHAMNFNYINNKQDTKQFGFVIEHDF
jgi:predicted porin